MLPDALETRCGSCTNIQKAKALDVITRLYYEHPQMYTALAERYDPSGEYTRNFESWFDEQNALKPVAQRQNANNLFITRAVTRESTTAALQTTPQAPTRRSQNINNSLQRTLNDVRTDRTRIPSTWITSTTTTTTTTDNPTTRPPLRTLPPTSRTTAQRFIPEEPLTQTSIFRTPSTLPSQVPIQRITTRQPPTTLRASTLPPTPSAPLPSNVQSFNFIPTQRQPDPVIFQEPPIIQRTTVRQPTEIVSTTDEQVVTVKVRPIFQEPAPVFRPIQDPAPRPPPVQNRPQASSFPTPIQTQAPIRTTQAVNNIISPSLQPPFLRESEITRRQQVPEQNQPVSYFLCHFINLALLIICSHKSAPAKLPADRFHR